MGPVNLAVMAGLGVGISTDTLITRLKGTFNCFPVIELFHIPLGGREDLFGYGTSMVQTLLFNKINYIDLR